MNTYFSRWLLILLVGLIGVIGFRAGAQDDPPSLTPTPTDNQSLYWFDWSNDGTKVAVATAKSISVYNSSFQLLVSRPQPDPMESRSFGSLSPDGTRLATAKEIWDTTTLQSLFQVDAEYPLGDWNSDGTLISGVALGAKAIVIYDGFTGRLVKTIPMGDILLLSNPIWSPDNMRFAFKTIGKKLIIVDVSQGKISASYSYESLIDSGLSWSHDSNKLAYDAFPEPKLGDSSKQITHSINIVDAANGEIIHTFTGLQDSVRQLLWNPNNTELLSASGFGQINVWDMNSKQLINSYITPHYLLIGIEYSSYGGQVMMGFNLDRDISSTVRNTFTGQSILSKPILDNAIQIIVPSPSLEKLKSITQACKLHPNIQEALISQINANDLNTFKTQVLALTNTDILSGCQADLLAITNALMAKMSE